MTLELDDDDTEAWVDDLQSDPPEADLDLTTEELKIVRELHFQKGWSTSAAQLGDLALVIENQSTSPSYAGVEFPERIKRAFLYLFPDAPGTTADGRAIGLPHSVMNAMRTSSTSITLEDETRWDRFTRTVEELLGWRLEPHASEPLARLSGFRLPQRNLGGGQQWVINMIWQLQEDRPIVAIEEPETHCHPGLARKLADSLRAIAPNTQFMLTTHSISMVDKATTSNNWTLTAKDGATEAHRIASSEDFKSMLHELGVVPSDVLARDFVLFVEGGTEAAAIVPRWASTLGYDIDGNMKVGVLSIGGAKRLKDNLRIWLSVMEHAPAEYHVMVDDHEAGDVARLSRELDIPQSRFTILPEHCIEDFYPPSLIVEALAAVFEIEGITVQKVTSKPRDRAIARVVTEAGVAQHGWKIPIAMYIGSRMTAEQIPEGFKQIVAQMRELDGSNNS